MRPGAAEAKISRIGSHPVDVGVIDLSAVFEFEDQNGPAGQDDDIGPASTLTRKFMFENDVRVAGRLKRARLVMQTELASPIAFVHAEEAVKAAMPVAGV